MQLARKIRQLIYFVGCEPSPLSPSSLLSLSLSLSLSLTHSFSRDFVLMYSRKCGPQSHCLSLSLSLFSPSTSLDMALLALLWRVAIGEVAVKSFMNFKQAPLNRATIISHFSVGTSEAQEGRACPSARIKEKERKRGKGRKSDGNRQRREPLVRLYDE